MDLISNIYRWYVKIQDIGQEEARQKLFIKNVTFFYGPGTLLYRYFTEFSIHMNNHVTYRYYVVRKEAEEQHREERGRQTRAPPPLPSATICR